MSEETRIAFLSVEKTVSGDGYIGGLLVTDSRGVPLEFLCTHAVKPSEMQRNLYGDTLEPHVSIYLCGKHLLDKLQTPVSVVLVKDTAMLSVRQYCEHPVISLRPQDSPDAPYKDVERKKLELEKGAFDVVETGYHKEHSADWEAAEPLLREASQNLDLLEPFQRIGTALHALGKKDERFTG